MSDKKYISLYKDMKNKILRAEYKPGEKLPSKRTVAIMTGFSLITVENAYRMLIDEGYVVSKEKSGYFVQKSTFLAPASDNAEKQPLALLDEESEEAAEENTFEYSVWCKTVRKVLSERGKELFVKSPPKGCAVLRNAIAEYLLRYRSMRAEPSRIIIGSGAEQLYETVARILGRNKIFGIENPCYGQISTVYEGMGVKLCHLDMGRDGIKSECLKNNKIDVLHVTPFHSYPSGVTASAPKRHEYLSWAEKTDGYIVEDDFDSEFFIPGNPISSLYSLDESQRVIYINTFSKSLSPSFRMGYMILPEHLLQRYEETVGKYSCTVPVLEQYTLARFICDGSFERHLNRVRRKNRQV